jgi:hypothetical protein
VTDLSRVAMTPCQALDVSAGAIAQCQALAVALAATPSKDMSSERGT